MAKSQVPLYIENLSAHSNSFPKMTCPFYIVIEAMIDLAIVKGQCLKTKNNQLMNDIPSQRVHLGNSNQDGNFVAAPIHHPEWTVEGDVVHVPPGPDPWILHDNLMLG